MRNYEKSGNGSGQRKDDDGGDNSPRSSEAEEMVDGDNRKSFLQQGWGSHLLYFWQTMDEHGVLTQSLSTLAKQGRADADGVPTTVAPVNKKSKRNDNSNRDLMVASIARGFEGLKDAQISLKDTQITKTIAELRGKALGYKKDLQTEDDVDVRNYINVALEETEEQIKDLKAKLSKG